MADVKMSFESINVAAILKKCNSLFKAVCDFYQILMLMYEVNHTKPLATSTPTNNQQSQSVNKSMVVVRSTLLPAPSHAEMVTLNTSGSSVMPNTTVSSVTSDKSVIPATPSSLYATTTLNKSVIPITPSSLHTSATQEKSEIPVTATSATPNKSETPVTPSSLHKSATPPNKSVTPVTPSSLHKSATKEKSKTQTTSHSSLQRRVRFKIPRVPCYVNRLVTNVEENKANGGGSGTPCHSKNKLYEKSHYLYNIMADNCPESYNRVGEHMLYRMFSPTWYNAPKQTLIRKSADNPLDDILSDNQ
jgi:hypothetical protein